MTTVDYEAIGRYTHAKEDLTAALRQRNSALTDLKRLLDKVINTSQGWEVPILLDVVEAKYLLNQAEAADAKARIAIGEANSEAQQAVKPVITWK